MKTIFKYIFASIFTGLCAIAYHATKRQSVSAQSSLQSTEIIESIAPVASNQLENVLPLRAQARHERAIMSEQQALLVAEEELSTIVPVYQVIDQPVGHTPKSVVQEELAVVSKPTVATTSTASSIPFPVADKSSVMPSYHEQSAASSNQMYETPMNGYDMISYPEQQLGCPAMQHNVSDINMHSHTDQGDHAPLQPLVQAPQTMQKVMNPELKTNENNTQDGHFVARKQKAQKTAAVLGNPIGLGNSQAEPQLEEDMVQDDGDQAEQDQAAAPKSWMSYLKNGLGYVGTAALACTAVALGYLGYASMSGK